MASTRVRRKLLKVATKEQQKCLKIVVIMFILCVEVSVGKVGIDKVTAESQAVNEGERALLPCYFTPTDADIGKWYWKTNGSAISRSDQSDPKSRYSLANASDGTGNASLIIKSVTRWDKGKYICGVDDESTTSTVAQSDVSILTVYYLENPKLEALGEKGVRKGAKISLKCKLALSYPEVTTINWFHENKKIKDDSDKYSIEDDILEIKQFDKRDEGNYSCRAENEVFADNNGKTSNTIAFYLLKDKADHTTIILILVVFLVTVALVVIIVGYIWYRKRQKEKLQDDIHQTVTSFMPRAEKQELVQVLPNLRFEFESKDSNHKEALDFGNKKSIDVTRGETITLPFKSTYNQKQPCFTEVAGYFQPFPCINLQHYRWEEESVTVCTSGDVRSKANNKNGIRKFGSNEFVWEVDKIKDGANGHITFKDITDDDEGQYVCTLQIKLESRTLNPELKTKFTFYGKTSIWLTNVIFRNVEENRFRPIRLILNGSIYLFVEDEIKEQYIMCKGKYGKRSDTKDIQRLALTWDDNADVLIKSTNNMKLLSFAILPGIHDPYIVLGFISHGKNGTQRKLVAIKESTQFHKISGVIDEQSDGRNVDLKFDAFSGTKLSTGRLVVGGFLKRAKCVTDNIFTIKYLKSSSTVENTMDPEIQSYVYESFIMWTDDENNWNKSSLNLRMNVIDDNMRFQITETGPNTVLVIISSLSSKKILYEGTSNDNCQTFTQNTRPPLRVPSVSFALSSERTFKFAPSLKNRPMSRKVSARLSSFIAKHRSSNSEQASVRKSPEHNENGSKEQKKEDIAINEESSLMNDGSSESPAKSDNRPTETAQPIMDRPTKTTQPTMDRPTKATQPTMDSLEGNAKREICKFKKPASAKTKKTPKKKTVKDYEALPTTEEGKEETTRTEGKDESSEIYKQREKIVISDLEIQTTASQQSEALMSDVENQPKNPSKHSLENIKERFVNAFSKLKKSEKKKTESLKGNEAVPVSVEYIEEESLMKEKRQDSQETDEHKDESVVSGTSKNAKKQKVVKKQTDKITRNTENQPSKSDRQVPTSKNVVKKSEDQTLSEGSSSKQKTTEDKTEVESSIDNRPTLNEPEGSSKRNKIATPPWLFSRLKSSQPPKHDEVMTPKLELPTENETREFEGLWHLVENQADKTAIRVRPVRDGDPRFYRQVTILKNRSKVKCEQIQPFNYENQSLFLMIYSTNFYQEEGVPKWRCTRYHVFSVDDLFK